MPYIISDKENSFDIIKKNMHMFYGIKILTDALSVQYHSYLDQTEHVANI